MVIAFQIILLILIVLGAMGTIAESDKGFKTSMLALTIAAVIAMFATFKLL